MGGRGEGEGVEEEETIVVGVRAGRLCLSYALRNILYFYFRSELSIKCQDRRLLAQVPTSAQPSPRVSRRRSRGRIGHKHTHTPPSLPEAARTRHMSRDKKKTRFLFTRRP